ncbi:MAG: hypothetical protein ABJL67_07855 [Sulfitobacter sp.]
MNTALAILAHALRMLVFDPATTLRVLMPAVLLVLGCSTGIAIWAPDVITLMNATPETIVPLAPGSALAFIVFGFAGLLGYALMAVLWHRHVLLNGAEQRDALHPSPAIFFGYLWRAVIVAIVQLIATIPVLLVMATLGSIFWGVGFATLSASLLALGASVIFIWIALRLSVVLPAAAMGHRIPVRESWRLTSNVFGELWGVALLLTGMNTLVYYITSAVLPIEGTLALLAQTAIFIIEGLVFISVLTTLYGNLVEGRSIGQERRPET